MREILPHLLSLLMHIIHSEIAIPSPRVTYQISEEKNFRAYTRKGAPRSVSHTAHSVGALSLQRWFGSRWAPESKSGLPSGRGTTATHYRQSPGSGRELLHPGAGRHAARARSLLHKRPARSLRRVALPTGDGVQTLDHGNRARTREAVAV